MFVNKFLDDLYVDDSTTGGKHYMKEKHFMKANKILQKVGFMLRKWIRNTTELQKYFEDRENYETETETGDDVSYLESQFRAHVINSKRVLGIKWDIGNDEFVFGFKKTTELTESLEITTRNISKIIATFYDSLGSINPITARVKSIFQWLCKDEKGQYESEAAGIRNV